MDNHIKLLTETIANHIAAGEVAPSPSYIVKELLENAIDAGAHNIRLDIRQGGKEMISVTDDGIGMSCQDARMAFERHATSKISSIEDLNNIHTFGFRGEALAAISAVTQIELKTRRAEDEFGTEVIINGGKLISCSPCTTKLGTIITARNIFFNVPARRKFLKDAYKEEKKILEEFERVAYVNENIAFSYYSSEKKIKELSKSSLLARILNLSKIKNMDRELIPINFEGLENGAFSIRGFIGTPSSSKKNYGYVSQYMFANGRYIKHNYFDKQIKLAYKDIIPDNHYTHYFIYINVPPEELDVNIHPTKIEVRFAQEQIIGEYLKSIIREALSNNASVPSIDFNRQIPDNDIPVYKHTDSFLVRSPQNTSEKKVFTTDKQFSFDNITNDSYVSFNWEELSTTFSRGSLESNLTLSQDIFFDSSEKIEEQGGHYSYKTEDFFIYKNRYIVIPLFKGITIIDLFHANERILYDKYYQDINNAVTKESQLHYIEPIKFDFSYKELKVAQRVMTFLSNIGFDFSHLGGETFAMVATPCSIKSDHCKILVEELINNISDVDDIDDIATMYVAKFIANIEASSIDIPQTAQEIDDLLSLLLRSTDPRLTPSGNNIYKTLGDIEIKKLFL